MKPQFKYHEWILFRDQNCASIGGVLPTKPGRLRRLFYLDKDRHFSEDCDEVNRSQRIADSKTDFNQKLTFFILSGTNVVYLMQKY